MLSYANSFQKVLKRASVKKFQVVGIYYLPRYLCVTENGKEISEIKDIESSNV